TTNRRASARKCFLQTTTTDVPYMECGKRSAEHSETEVSHSKQFTGTTGVASPRASSCRFKRADGRCACATTSLDSEIDCGNYSPAMPINYDPKADYYALLCIEAAASPEDIKKAHRARIGELHPDRGGDSAQASAVNVARDVLCDPDSRRAYD